MKCSSSLWFRTLLSWRKTLSQSSFKPLILLTWSWSQNFTILIKDILALRIWKKFTEDAFRLVSVTPVRSRCKIDDYATCIRASLRHQVLYPQVLVQSVQCVHSWFKTGISPVINQCILILHMKHNQKYLGNTQFYELLLIRIDLQQVIFHLQLTDKKCT